MDGNTFWAALALVLVLEGLFPLLSPAGWRAMFHKLLALADGQLYFGERITNMCELSGRPKALGPFGLDPR